ncbi:MAG: SDR family oxidoreductase [SAR324 cluster bacterium]|nr:SDR family oxidoreductase [SAR324 cluster bacterium]MCH8885343.1 SDR family oxidoreductase [SAR324 cluster bacterium]
MSGHAFDLSGKAALVTGGNSGIGLGMAKGLAAAGAGVCIWGTNPDKNAAALEQLRDAAKGAATPGQVMALQCDVGDEDAVERGFAETVDALGKVDACFANAGIGSGRRKSFAEMTTEEWRRVMNINLEGAFFTLRAAVRHMMERGQGGSLVGTASLSAMEGAPRGQHYAASKGGLISLIKSLAVEYGRKGIRANAIVPGWIESAMTRDFFALKAVQEKVLTRVPMKRWGTGDDFAGIACYLTSDASAYHSGDTFVIDGAYALF